MAVGSVAQRLPSDMAEPSSAKDDRSFAEKLKHPFPELRDQLKGTDPGCMENENWH